MEKQFYELNKDVTAREFMKEQQEQQKKMQEKQKMAMITEEQLQFDKISGEKNKLAVKI